MSQELRRRLFEQLDSLTLIDPHTHIDPRQPASRTLADILGYHYYTELAHSAGLATSEIGDETLTPREKVRRLIENLGPIDNTIQWSWLLEMSQKLFGFEGDQINRDNWESLYDAAEDKMASAEWAQQVLDQSKVRSVFLTNNFDDDLEGFDTNTYIPCLRTDDLVFNLAKSETQQRLERATGVSLGSAKSLREAIGTLFDTFTANGARACAISLPPDFTPMHISEARADTAIEALLARGVDSSESHKRAIANFVFWTLAEYCNEYRLPFDLMIGVNRDVYPNGVHQGRDLYDSRVSLIQYKELFNGFPHVTFPVSVLASVTNQELVSYSWIFPNVVTNGHWWYSNTPAYIEQDLAARLEGVPRTKQIGYYSDAYKLEFVLPKFAMYKRILAKVLAERFVIDRAWSEDRAYDLGKQVLAGNVNRVFTEAQRPTVVMGRSRDSRVFGREISMNEAQAAATAGQLGEFYNERIEPDSLASGDYEGDELTVGSYEDDAAESVGSNDLGALDLEERDREEQGDFGSFVSKEAGGSGSNVLDKMELQPSFSDEELDEIEAIDMLPMEELQPSDDDTLLGSSLPPLYPPAGDMTDAPELEVVQLEEQGPVDLGIETGHEHLESSPFKPEPINAAEEAWSPIDDIDLNKPDDAQFDQIELDEVELEDVELDAVELESLEEVSEVSAIDFEDAAQPSAAVDEDEFTRFEVVADDDDTSKTQRSPFLPPEKKASEEDDSGTWDFLGGKK
jgi:glucuronate isomerase